MWSPDDSGYPVRGRLRLGSLLLVPFIGAGLLVVGSLAAGAVAALPRPSPGEVRAFVAQLGTRELPTPKPHPTPKGKPKGKAAVGSVPGVPAPMLRLYDQTGAGERWPARDGRRYPAWSVLAAIGSIESDHGRSSAPGVHAGLNRHGCCAGPMQFNLRDGPPSTWASYGRGSVYDPADAVPAAGRKLRADGAARDLDGAVHAYNHSWAYVAQVKALARHYQDRRS